MFTGSNFPVTQLPIAGQGISAILPLTRSIAAARCVMSGAEYEKVLPLIGIELVVGVVYVFLATIVMGYAEKTAIKKGTLELF